MITGCCTVRENEFHSKRCRTIGWHRKLVSLIIMYGLCLLKIVSLLEDKTRALYCANSIRNSNLRQNDPIS